ncbi:MULTISPECIES: FtsQ-type POTRA domain-containing protein [Microbacterium]|uniref:FtsQ-type POTRA domain-containing protein n=1 Tax=Microbacterium TaxID=33882 RepID=UPI0011EA8A03|nr:MULTISPECIES: FtsQ-type POTRA domain-containing protein [Microbacterium]
MRRPPPLPSAPDTPEHTDASPEGISRRRGSSLTPTVDDSPASAVEPAAAGEEERVGPSSSMDVWRAARARRKALRAEIRRFTQRSRRRRIVWLSVLGVVVLLIGGSVAAAYSPLFAVQRITVTGATTIDPAVIEGALDDQLGTPLALVDTSEVKAALLAFPLIETYALEARPPHDLTVRIVERTPIGVIESGAGFTLVDAAGVALSTTADRPDGQPLVEVEGGVDSRAFRSAGLVVRALPADIRSALTGVRASTADDVTLTLDSGLTVVWGSQEDSGLKALALSAALVKNPDAASIDVTSPDVAVVG